MVDKRKARIHRRSEVSFESGETLVEVLIAIVIIGLTATALLGGFVTSISASAEHRNFAAIDTVLKSYVESATYQLQQQQNFKFLPNPQKMPTVCPDSTTYNSTISPLVSGNYTAKISSVQFWTGSTWSLPPDSTTWCTSQPNGANANPPDPELITAEADGNGGSESLLFVVNDPDYNPAPPAANRAPTFNSATGVNEITGTYFTFAISATGPPAPSLTETGPLPSGVTFADNGGGYGVLQGTPAAGSQGSYPISFRATNGVSPDATQNFTLVVNAPAMIVSADSASVAAGTPLQFSVVATGTAPISLTESGALPLGVSFTDNGGGNGSLSGTPVALDGTTYPITFTASNGVGANDAQQFTLSVSAFGATDLGNNGSSPCATLTNNACNGPSVTTTSGNNELVLVNMTGANSSSGSITSISGPFSPATQLTSVAYDGGKSTLFAWNASGSGSTGTVKVTFNNAVSSVGSVYIEVLQINAGDALGNVSSNAGANSGSQSSLTATITPNNNSDSEIAFLGNDSGQSFNSVPSGWMQYPGFTPTDWNSFGIQTIQPSQDFSMSGSGANWAFIAIEVSP